MIIAALVILMLMVMTMFGMAKWFSVLFSDARNKLGNQVVFSNWKGRPYMRAYVKPANPDTLGQRAQRNKQTLSVSQYQSVVTPEATAKTLWNELALSRQISGFNLFMKYALKIDAASLSGGAEPFDNTITYTCPTDVALMGMYHLKDGVTLVEVAEKGTLSAGVDQTVPDTALPQGEYEYFIGPADVFNDLAGDAKDAVMCAHWKNNPATGFADAAVCTVTP